MNNKSTWKWIVGALLLIAVIYGAMHVFGEPWPKDIDPYKPTAVGID